MPSHPQPPTLLNRTITTIRTIDVLGTLIIATSTSGHSRTTSPSPSPRTNTKIQHLQGPCRTIPTGIKTKIPEMVAKPPRLAAITTITRATLTPIIRHYHQPYQGQSYQGQQRRQTQYQNQNWSSTPDTSQSLVEAAAEYLNQLCVEVLEDSDISAEELAAKDEFRTKLQAICRKTISEHETVTNQNADFTPESVELRCFGSVASGFATKGSDMDLGLVTPNSALQPSQAGSPIPRLIEKAFLEMGFGARLLTRTRVPIIKLCEKPTSELLDQLLKERERWEKGEEGSDSDDLRNASPSPDSTHNSHDVSIVLEDASKPKAPGDGPATEHSHSMMDNSPLIVSGRILLAQQTNQSLASYFTTARKLLMQQGIQNYEEVSFTDEDRTLTLTLNKMCYAFIQGLSDAQLKERLLSRPYNHFTPDEMSPDLPEPGSTDFEVSFPHSMSATCFQAEAEDHLMRWDSRPRGHFSEEIEKASTAMARQLEDMLCQESFNPHEAVDYSRELFSVLSRFKQLSVVQVVTLEQRPNEQAMDYYNRANRLFRTLSHSRAPATDLVIQFFLYHFIQGVYKPEFREALTQFNTIPDPITAPTLADLALRLKTLHLAADFEAALAKDSYPEESKGMVLAYVDILRRPLTKLHTAGARAWYKYALPITPQDKPIMDHIKALGDPSLLSQTKERYRDELEFPKEGVGAQCDVNFSAHLALQNSLLLRCYSHTDPRVRKMVLFIKRWAKNRQINTPYRGSLSSYGYALMVLHYLVNVAEPFVCPNLQRSAPPKSAYTPEEYPEKVECQGYDVRFMRDEEALKAACAQNTITANTESLGHLLCGFFEYFAQSGQMVTIPGRKGFDWGREVLSLRTFPGGILTKQAKGWTGAKTVLVVDNATSTGTSNARTTPSISPAVPATPLAGEPVKKVESGATETPEIPLKEVRCRYLFAIEDPFELEHNVARTVTHHGITSIRDEFRRAWRILQGVHNNSNTAEEVLMEAVSLESQQDKSYMALLDSIHSPGQQ
ncbi:hypothetical protein TD95_003017 [Thielaviopsis punctulata]|uniref:polynucleotide adenylyltransferase n=1 Tax=Thielaviopsis punctulata TaxID=72032 RepID=A0A0F4ZEG9_9PEZI|nr:hypothetical protein TD95_003017 [Thielaviopsis punctulata]